MFAALKVAVKAVKAVKSELVGAYMPALADWDEGAGVLGPRTGVVAVGSGFGIMSCISLPL